jgi:diaminobutyrate-2-oxoglutarate transaminase
LPLSLLLIRPDLDIWSPGEHTGTFRGNNLALVTATEALHYWRDDSFKNSILEKSNFLSARLEQLAAQSPDGKARVRGRGLIQGLVFPSEDMGRKVASEAFCQGLIIEACGPCDDVLKFLPPLTVTQAQLEEAVFIVENSMKTLFAEHKPTPLRSAP